MKLDHPRPGQKLQLKVLWQEAFGDTPEFIDSFFAAAYAPGRCLCAFTEDRVAAAAYVFDCSFPAGKLAYIYAVATAWDFRGQGLCHALLQELHSRLARQGYTGTVLVPGNADLAELYRGMGYAYFGGVDTVSCAAAEPVQLRSLTAMEYLRLRQKYLPENAVRQAGENLRFLQKNAVLAAGTDFVLAYSPEKDGLWGMELLGNAAAAPGILGALGVQKGRFRVPGGKPFAMYRPLTAAAPPAYFGLAFD